jgi:3-oxoacyl-[acyl-carrier-protein] synthase II
MSGHPDIAVSGIGLVSPLGVGVAANWAGLCDGKPTATTDHLFAGLPVDFSCPVSGFDGTSLLGRDLSWRMEPFAQMVVVAAREAVAQAGLDPAGWDGSRVAVVLGVASSSMGPWPQLVARVGAGQFKRVSPMALPRSLPNLAAGEVCLDLGAMGPSLTVSTACASGATAIGIGRDLLRSGACDIAIVGGTESGRTPLASAAFGRMGALSTRCADPGAASRPFDVDCDGFVLAEGAGVLVLERAEDAGARGAAIQGRLMGFGASADAHHITAPHPDGLGVALAVDAALRDAGMTAEEVGHVNAHATSTPAGDAAEAGLLTRLFPHAPPVTATKSLTGHALGAAGALEAAFTLLTIQHREVPAIANLDTPIEPARDLDLVRGAPAALSTATGLSNSFGFGGQNAALIFAAA